MEEFDIKFKDDIYSIDNLVDVGLDCLSAMRMTISRNDRSKEMSEILESAIELNCFVIDVTYIYLSIKEKYWRSPNYIVLQRGNNRLTIRLGDNTISCKQSIVNEIYSSHTEKLILHFPTIYTASKKDIWKIFVFEIKRQGAGYFIIDKFEIDIFSFHPVEFLVDFVKEKLKGSLTQISSFKDLKVFDPRYVWYYEGDKSPPKYKFEVQNENNTLKDVGLVNGAILQINSYWPPGLLD